MLSWYSRVFIRNYAIISQGQSFITLLKRLHLNWPFHPGRLGRCFVQQNARKACKNTASTLLKTKKHPHADAFMIFQQCSIFPGRRQPSIFDDEKLNFCVRYVYRWILFSIATGNGIISSLMLGITKVMIWLYFLFWHLSIDFNQFRLG